MKAFAGESQARNRYTFAAEEEGFMEVASAFFQIAEIERKCVF